MPKRLLEWRLSAHLSKSIHAWLLTQEYHLLGVAGCRRSVEASDWARGGELSIG